MSVLIFIDQSEGQIKKTSYEALSYGAELARQQNTTAEGLIMGSHSEDLTSIGRYGVKTVHHASDASFDQFDALRYAKAIEQAVTSTGADTIIFSHNMNGRAIAPILSARMKAGLVTGVTALPESADALTARKNVYSGKAFARVKINTDKKIISINPNSYQVKPSEGTAEVKAINISVEPSRIKITAVNKVTGQIPLSEAERVISGGRGLKGPENWGMVEELAQLLNAATACSRAVADAHWRPHHEHVGQTGLAIAPNLYFAIGISGAIQHLAGVNRSKTIVVINKDPEAPFFKAADYGIVGDAFEVVPKIIEELKKH